MINKGMHPRVVLKEISLFRPQQKLGPQLFTDNTRTKLKIKLLLNPFPKLIPNTGGFPPSYLSSHKERKNGEGRCSVAMGKGCLSSQLLQAVSPFLNWHQKNLAVADLGKKANNTAGGGDRNFCVTTAP